MKNVGATEALAPTDKAVDSEKQPRGTADVVLEAESIDVSTASPITFQRVQDKENDAQLGVHVPVNVSEPNEKPTLKEDSSGASKNERDAPNFNAEAAMPMTSDAQSEDHATESTVIASTPKTVDAVPNMTLLNEQSFAHMVLPHTVTAQTPPQTPESNKIEYLTDAEKAVAAVQTTMGPVLKLDTAHTTERTGLEGAPTSPKPAIELAPLARPTQQPAPISVNIPTASLPSNGAALTTAQDFFYDSAEGVLPEQQLTKSPDAALSKTVPLAQPSTVADTNVVAAKGSGTVEPTDSLLTATDTPEPTVWDAPRLVPTTFGATPPQRADLAPHIARQIVEVISHAAHRPVEIALSPQELGRVRISLSTDDGAITVNILAERPDTLDLMRRHIDQLGQTFRAMGYESISFSFGQGEESDNTSHDGSNSTQGATAQTDSTKDLADAPLIQLDPSPTRGVDIRL